MATATAAPESLRKGAKVVARQDLRDVPEGTKGKVSMVSGLTWTRYWVRFENGISLGTLDRKVLATPDQWKRFLAGEDEVIATGSSSADAGAAADDDGGADGGGKTTPSGTFVSQKLLDRAAAARVRLTA